MQWAIEIFKKKLTSFFSFLLIFFKCAFNFFTSFSFFICGRLTVFRATTHARWPAGQTPARRHTHRLVEKIRMGKPSLITPIADQFSSNQKIVSLILPTVGPGLLPSAIVSNFNLINHCTLLTLLGEIFILKKIPGHMSSNREVIVQLIIR